MKYHQYASHLLLKFASCCNWAHDISFTNLLYFSSKYQCTFSLTASSGLGGCEGECFADKEINPRNVDDNHANDDITVN